MFEEPYFYKKSIFFLAIIGIGLVSRFMYKTDSNFAVAENKGPTSSLAFIASDMSSGSGTQQGFLSENNSVSNTQVFSMNNISAEQPTVLQGNVSALQSDASAISKLQYEAALIADLQTGAIYFGNNNNKRWPLASITKLMTATVVMDNFSMDQAVMITSEAFAADPNEKTLRVGDVYTASDLLRFLLLPSSNVAAEAFADSYGRDRFLSAMNARAIAWGMIRTHYDDPSGLSSGNQSTADDLLLLAKKIYSDYPKILPITRTAQIYVTELSSEKKVFVKSINDFAGDLDFIGGKTGYTTIADGNLLSLFQYHNRPVLIIVLGTDQAERFTNTEKLYNWYKSQSQ